MTSSMEKRKADDAAHLDLSEASTVYNVTFAFFQSSGTSSDCYDLSRMIDSNLAMI